MSTQNAFAESGTSPTITTRITASNDSERAECRRLMKNGFTVLKRGVPDFFAFKEVDGGMEFCFVEVKNEATDDLSQEPGAVSRGPQAVRHPGQGGLVHDS